MVYKYYRSALSKVVKQMKNREQERREKAVKGWVKHGVKKARARKGQSGNKGGIQVRGIIGGAKDGKMEDKKGKKQG